MKQVKDEPKLLELMMEDMTMASDLYKPTNYWNTFENKSLLEIKKFGLKDFRGRKDSMLYFFGGTDLFPSSRASFSFVKSNNPFKIIRNYLLEKLLKTKKNHFIRLAEIISGVNNDDLNFLFFQLAKFYGKARGAKPIESFDSSDIGNPENIFSDSGKSYSLLSLRFYIEYSYCCQYINFDSIKTITELGSGAGGQIEVLKKLYPNICFYLFDIPPQLYVCEEYLKALFPNDVISYNETRKLKTVPYQPGKIFIFGSWMLSQLKDLSYDLFWNSNSFQEMEPDIVLNYLSFVNKQTSKYVFLNENIGGVIMANKKGEVGVLKPTKIEHYKKGLKYFELKNMSNAIRVDSRPKSASSLYKFSIWEKSTHKTRKV